MLTDPDVHILFVVQTTGPLSRKGIKVQLSEDYNRKCLSSYHEDMVSKIWVDRVSKNATLYNGSKFRLDSITNHVKDDEITLKLGLTCYKEYLGTNWSADIKDLRKQGQLHHGNAQAYLSDPLGVGAFVVTADEKVLFIKRSNHCGEAEGMLDVPGGHAEPEMVVGKKEFQDIDLKIMNPDDVVKEIFESILREIQDEVNIPLSALSDPLVLGIAQNTKGGYRPSMEFLVRCNLTFPEVLELYLEGNQSEAYESTNLEGLSLSDLLSLQQRVPEKWHQFAPSAKGCIMLYGLACGL